MTDQLDISRYSETTRKHRIHKSMSNRINTITVVLEKETRDDDCKSILDAIRIIRGVLTATPNVADHTEYMAQERAKRELGEKLWEVLYPKSSR